MRKNNLDALIITGTDPHNSEYLPDHWKTREYLTGFTGSYGMVVITLKEAGLWTDTRYFIQAETQLRGTGIKMHKLRIPGAVLPEVWLVQKLISGSRIGVDLQTITVNQYRIFKSALFKGGMEIVGVPDFFESHWTKRPSMPNNPIYEHLIEFSGVSAGEKINLIKEELKVQKADLHIVTSLDELAWVFNLRGSDIKYNPVFIGFGMIGKSKSTLFIHREKVPDSLKRRLTDEKIDLVDYNSFFEYLSKIKSKTFYLDSSAANQMVYEKISINNQVVEGVSILSKIKSKKNKTEIEGFRIAMKKDGAALVEFLYWLKNSLGKEHITEYTVGRKLAQFRSKQPGFAGESFAPIVGYRQHGAIVHLSVDETNALPVEPEGILLFDSGGQYYTGTTDITRTVALGAVTEQQKTDFTLVLKGMITLSNVTFPAGTLGCHLDILARKALWSNGLNYGHGTGHGVGYFLNVHEGPMSIRQEYNPIPIEPGNVLSNEPALYREGEYGIRTENMMVCIEKETTIHGKFLGFETLSLCPVDTTLINRELLTPEEKNFLNHYQRTVYAELCPLLSTEIRLFLGDLTKEI
jgi:Xaa-Pro aminopeptidase